MTLLFATSNANKVREIASLLPEGITVQSLSDIGWTAELPETRDTIEGNSLQKAEYLAQRLGVTCFAEDTGLIIDALDGRPGVYSARYAGPAAAYQDNVAKVLAEMEGVDKRTARFKTVITYYSPHSSPQTPKGGFNTKQPLSILIKPPLREVWRVNTQGSTPKSPEGDLNTSKATAVEAPFRGFGGKDAEEGAAAHYPDGDYVQFTGLCEGTILTEARGAEGFGYDPIFVPDGCNLSFAEMRLNEKNVFSHRKKALEQFLQYLKNL